MHGEQVSLISFYFEYFVLKYEVIQVNPHKCRYFAFMFYAYALFPLFEVFQHSILIVTKIFHSYGFYILSIKKSQCILFRVTAYLRFPALFLPFQHPVVRQNHESYTSHAVSHPLKNKTIAHLTPQPKQP